MRAELTDDLRLAMLRDLNTKLVHRTWLTRLHFPVSDQAEEQSTSFKSFCAMDPHVLMRFCVKQHTGLQSPFVIKHHVLVSVQILTLICKYLTV